MSLEIGSIVEGVVTGIVNYGAFVRLPEGKTGLIHISEVADTYVKDVRDYLKEKDKVKVKILGVNEKGKYDLSLKQAKEKPDVPQEAKRQERPFKGERRRSSQKLSFEDKLSQFLKQSEERLLDLKRNTESKRRGRGR